MVFACMGTLGAESPWAEKNEAHGFPKPFKNLSKTMDSELFAAPGSRRPEDGTGHGKGPYQWETASDKQNEVKIAAPN